MVKSYKVKRETDHTEGQIASRYSKLSTVRDSYLKRARTNAELTIPTLFPPEGSSSSTEFYTPFQSMGARGVNTLSSKLLLTLMPPNSPFFRMSVDEQTIKKVSQDPRLKTKMDEALGGYERSIMRWMEINGFRVSVFEAIKLLVMSGNCLIFVPPQGTLRVFRLDRYVVKRDPMGRVIEIIVCEDVDRASLSDELKGMLPEDKNPGTDPNKPLRLYTRIWFKDGEYHICQELVGIKVPESEGTYPLEKLPWIALRMIKVDGEDYGRSYVDEYQGDLRSLEGLSRAIVEGSAAAAKLLFLINPNGVTQSKDLANTPNGGFATGMVNDVTVLQLNKQADMSVAQQTASIIEQRLAYAFLMNTAIQRTGERVTAEEIRYMAGELEDALGGIYSILSQEFQLPLINAVINIMTKAGVLPTLPEGVVSPAITTGLEALGRGHDLNRLQSFMQNLSALGPELIGTYVNVSDYITRVGTSLGIDMNGLIKSEDEVTAMQQQQMQQQQMQGMVEKLGPAAINGLSKVVSQTQQ